MSCPKCGDKVAWTKCWVCGWEAPVGTMEFVLPLPVNLGNARLHWAAKNKLKNKWYETADLTKTPSIPSEPLSKASVHAHFYLHNLMDSDNMGARCKWILDWLVTRGYLKDDSDKVIEWIPPTQEIDRKNKRVVVCVEPR